MRRSQEQRPRAGHGARSRLILGDQNTCAPPIELESLRGRLACSDRPPQIAAQWGAASVSMRHPRRRDCGTPRCLSLGSQWPAGRWRGDPARRRSVISVQEGEPVSAQPCTRDAVPRLLADVFGHGLCGRVLAAVRSALPRPRGTPPGRRRRSAPVVGECWRGRRTDLRSAITSGESRIDWGSSVRLDDDRAPGGSKDLATLALAGAAR